MSRIGSLAEVHSSVAAGVTNMPGGVERALAELPALVTAAVVTATPAQLVDLRARTEALRGYARQARLGMQAQNAAAEARLRLERRLGEVLTGRVGRGRPKNVEPIDNLRLADLGVSRDLSARAQRIAAIRPAFFERFFKQAREFGWEITTATFFQRTEGDEVNEVVRQRMEISARGMQPYRPPPTMGKPTTLRLLHGDCLDVMAEIPDHSVDLIATDLPYGSTICEWDTPIDLPALWAHYTRIIRPYHAIVLTATQPFTSILGASNIEWLKYDLVWLKPHAADFVQAKNRPLRVHESVLVFSQGKLSPESRSSRRMPYYPRGLASTNDDRAFVKRPSAHSEVSFKLGSGHRSFQREFTGYPRSVMAFARDHPALHPVAKPVALMRWLIEMFTLPGQTVLDSCMGSGSTGVAALQSGRCFIGIELDQHYFEVATDRLRAIS